VLLSSPEFQKLSSSQREDLRLASSKLSGAKRRYFQAAIAIKYCQVNARLTERMLGWSRKNVALGLAEKRTGIICVGSQTGFSGAKRWEEKQPLVANSLVKLAESHSQQDPTFTTTIAYTRLTAAAALKQLAQQGFKPEQLPSLSTMTEVLNRMGYRLRKVVKAKPQKAESVRSGSPTMQPTQAKSQKPMIFLPT
jgi:Rhodopirellula transposase DDE domain